MFKEYDTPRTCHRSNSPHFFLPFFLHVYTGTLTFLIYEPYERAFTTIMSYRPELQTRAAAAI